VRWDWPTDNYANPASAPDDDLSRDERHQRQWLRTSATDYQQATSDAAIVNATSVTNWRAREPRAESIGLAMMNLLGRLKLSGGPVRSGEQAPYRRYKRPIQTLQCCRRRRGYRLLAAMASVIGFGDRLQGAMEPRRRFGQRDLAAPGYGRRFTGLPHAMQALDFLQHGWQQRLD